MKASAQIFLSYAREDKDKVEKLYQRLSDAGFKPWMDKKDILPGEKWPSRIRRAIQDSDFFLACLSANSVTKRGWIQRETRNALDLWQEKLEEDIYLIPVRLDDCEVPESLRDFQWVDLFKEDGWTHLLEAIQTGIARRGDKPKPKEGPEPVFGDSWKQFVSMADGVVVWDPESQKAIDPLEKELRKASVLINREGEPEEWESLLKAISDFCQYTSTQANKTLVRKLRELVAELVNEIIASLSAYKHLASIEKQLDAIVHQLQH